MNEASGHHQNCSDGNRSYNSLKISISWGIFISQTLVSCEEDYLKIRGNDFRNNCKRISNLGIHLFSTITILKFHKAQCRNKLITSSSSNKFATTSLLNLRRKIKLRTSVVSNLLNKETKFCSYFFCKREV